MSIPTADFLLRTNALLLILLFAAGGAGEYHRVNQVSELVDEVTAALAAYNANTTKKMSLVFFEDAVMHVARIYRVLRQPRGNAMCVGMGGSGRQSMTRMAASMANCVCRQIEIRKVPDPRVFYYPIFIMLALPQCSYRSPDSYSPLIVVSHSHCNSLSVAQISVAIFAALDAVGLWLSCSLLFSPRA